MNETINLLKKHQSCRKFDERPIEREKLMEMIEAGTKASTSSYVQAYSVVRVTKVEVKDEMAELAGGQKWVSEAPEFLVFLADMNKLKIATELHEKEFFEGYTESFLIASVDAALMAQNVLVAGESLGLGGVFIGGIRNNPERVSELLELPEHVYPVFGMALGYPKYQTIDRPRLPLDLVMFEDTYGPIDIELLKSYDEDVKTYYIERTKGKLDNTWTEQMSDKMSGELRPHMLEYLKSKKFLLK